MAPRAETRPRARRATSRKGCKNCSRLLVARQRPTWRRRVGRRTGRRPDGRRGMNKRSGAVGAATMVLIALGLAAPAWALDVRWFSRDVNYFAGLRCGDADQVPVPL